MVKETNEGAMAQWAKGMRVRRYTDAETDRGISGFGFAKKKIEVQGCVKWRVCIWRWILGNEDRVEASKMDKMRKKKNERNI